MNNLYKFEFLKRKKTLLFWLLGVVGIMLLYMLLFPIVKDMTQTMADTMGEELFEMFGLESMTEMGNYNSYFAAEFQILILAICGYATFAGANIFHEEINSGSAEFLYNIKYSRKTIFFAKSLAVLTMSLILLFSTMIICILCGLIVASSIVNIPAILFTYLILTLPVLFSWSFGIFMSCILKKNSNAGAIALSILVVSYFVGYISLLGPEPLKFIVWFSPLILLAPNEAMNYILSSSDLTIFRVLFVLIICAGLYVSSYFLHNKRDI